MVGNIGGPELEDVDAGLADLIARGIADRRRAVVGGWSWGGYVTLMELGTHPDPWVCGVAGIPVGVFELAVAIRAIVLILCVIGWIRGRHAAAPGSDADEEPGADEAFRKWQEEHSEALSGVPPHALRVEYGRAAAGGLYVRVRIDEAHVPPDVGGGPEAA